MFDQRSGVGCFDPILHRTADRSATPANGQVTSAKEQQVRTYDDPVDVRKGPADGPVGQREEGPAQFLWRGRLWQVREVIAHWMETGSEAMVASGGPAARAPRHREVWRVAAARGRAVSSADDPGFGIFDLTYDRTVGGWHLAGSLD